MSTKTSPARLHRAFCVAAVVHAAVILALVFPVYTQESWLWLPHLWVGITTLWFYWPVLLALHVGRPRRRCYIAIGGSALLLLFPMWSYMSLFGPWVLVRDFGPRSLNPLEAAVFGGGYVSGWIESKQRNQGDTITIEGYGMGGSETPGVPTLSAGAAKRYNLTLNSTGHCGVNPYIFGRAAGYNAASVRLLKRRYGSDILAVLEREWMLEQERSEVADEAGRADAQRDIAAGQLALEVFTNSEDSAESDMTPLTQHGIALRYVDNGNERIGLDVLRHASAYNQVVEAELERRYGVEAARAVVEAAKQYALYAGPPP